jgi:hypothetical protein
MRATCKSLISSDAIGVLSCEPQLRFLSEKFDRTANQEAKITPFLNQSQDATLQVVQNESLSRDERMSHVRPLRVNAHKHPPNLHSKAEAKARSAHAGTAAGTARRLNGAKS